MRGKHIESSLESLLETRHSATVVEAHALSIRAARIVDEQMPQDDHGSYTQKNSAVIHRAAKLSGLWNRHYHNSLSSHQTRHQPSGLHYLWTVALSNTRFTSYMCSKNVNELKQYLLDVWYVMEQSIIDSAINEWPMSIQAYLGLKREF